MRTLASAIAIALTAVAAAIVWVATSPMRGWTPHGQRQPHIVSHNPLPEAAYEQFRREAEPSQDAFRKARALLASGDVAGAETECRRAVDLSPRISTPTTGPVPTNARALQLLGEIYLRQGRNRQ